MTNLERVQAIMEELGPAMPDVDAVVQQGDSTWAVAFADELIVVIELDSLERRLVLSIDVGRPSDEAKGAVYETALTYAYLWRDTGGARLALGGADGELALLFDVELAELTLPDLQSMLLDLAQKGRIWRGFVAGAVEAPSMVEVGIRI